MRSARCSGPWFAPASVVRCVPARRRTTRLKRGFTLLEILFVITIIMVVATFGIPSFIQLQKRFAIEGVVGAVTQTLARARTEAVTRGVSVVVEARMGSATENHQLYAFADVRDAGAGWLEYEPDPAAPARSVDYEVATYTLPWQSQPQMFFWDVDEISPGIGDFLDDFTKRDSDDETVIVFDPDGTIRDTGTIRLGSGPYPRAVASHSDYERNYFEIRIEPKASARIDLLKWVPTGVAASSGYFPKTSNSSGVNWRWY